MLQYRIYCDTEQEWKTWWLPDTSPSPTACPTDTNHTTNVKSVSIEDESSTQEVKVEQISVPVGQEALLGHTAIQSLPVTALPNEEKTVTWKLPIPAALSSYHVRTHADNQDDMVTIRVGDPFSHAKTRSESVVLSDYDHGTYYVIGEVVLYDNIAYHCTQDTQGTQRPIGLRDNYWQPGNPIYLDEWDTTHDMFAKKGSCAILDDGGAWVELGRVIMVNRSVPYMLTEKGPSRSMPAGTILRIQEIALNKFVLGPAGSYDFGSDNIAARYVPSLTPLTITYFNKSPTLTKTLYMWAEIVT
jgi:hypothetical protein